MFLMIAVGILLVRCRVLKKEAGSYLSKIVLYVVLPCTIINAFQIEYSSQIMNGLVLAFAAALVCNIVLILVPYAFRRKLKLTAVEQASLSYSNCGDILIPLVVSVLSAEMQIYCCAFLMVQIFFIFTHGISLISGQKVFRLKTIFKNVNVIAIITGCILFLTDLQLPFFLKTPINSFAGMVAPACMLVIGIAIGDCELRDIFGEKRNYLLCFIRLIAIPVLILILMKLTGIAEVLENGKEILLIVFMAAASSPANTVANIAQSYGKDGRHASIINVMGVLFLIVSLPLMVALYQFII